MCNLHRNQRPVGSAPATARGICAGTRARSTWGLFHSCCAHACYRYSGRLLGSESSPHVPPPILSRLAVSPRDGSALTFALAFAFAFAAAFALAGVEGVRGHPRADGRVRWRAEAGDAHLKAGHTLLDSKAALDAALATARRRTADPRSKRQRRMRWPL